VTLQAYQSMRVWRYGMIGFDVLPYQLSLGITIRIFEGGLYLRLYVGPFKLLGGLNKMDTAQGKQWHPCEKHGKDQTIGLDCEYCEIEADVERVQPELKQGG